METLDRRTRKTRTAIRNAFCTLIKEKKINCITVSEITELADISRTTFYLHYTDIYNLLEEIENDVYINLAKMMGTVNFGVSVPLTFYEELFRYFLTHPEGRILFASNHGIITAGKRVTALITNKYLEEQPDLFKDNRRKMYYATFAVRGTIGMLEAWINDGMQETPEKMALVITDFQQMPKKK